MSVVKRNSYGVEKAPVRSSVGTGMLVFGAGGLGLTALAALLPFVGVFGVSVLLVLGGIALKL